MPFPDQRHNAAEHESNGQSDGRQVLNAIDLSGQSNAAAVADASNRNDVPVINELLEPAVVSAQLPNEAPAGSTSLQSSAAVDEDRIEEDDDGNRSLERAVVIAQVSNEAAGSTLLHSSASIDEDQNGKHDGNGLLQHAAAVDLRRPSAPTCTCALSQPGLRQPALVIAQDLNNERGGHWSPQSARVFNSALNPACIGM